MGRIMCFTEAEDRICTFVGKQRFANAMGHARDAGKGPSKYDLTPANHIRGAHCEFATSVLLNLYWRPTIGSVRDRDVGGLVEARSTVLPHGRLIVKPDDDNGVPFVLIKALHERYEAVGWIFSDEAKGFPLLTQHGDPAHFVPQRCLRPMDELFRWIRKKVDG